MGEQDACHDHLRLLLDMDMVLASSCQSPSCTSRLFHIAPCWCGFPSRKAAGRSVCKVSFWCFSSRAIIDDATLNYGTLHQHVYGSKFATRKNDDFGDVFCSKQRPFFGVSIIQFGPVPIWTSKFISVGPTVTRKNAAAWWFSQIGNWHYLLFPKMGFRCLKSNVDSFKMLYKPILDVIVMVFWWYNYL